MSFYQFSPCPDLSTRETNFASWENSFSESDITRIRNLGDSLCMTQAVTGDGNVSEIRKSKVGWIPFGGETGWLYDRLAGVARQANGQFFDFDLTGFSEDFQYTVYGQNGDHYGWHMDKGLLNGAPRKLSMVLHLSDPSEYEGGELEVLPGNESITLEARQGLVHLFPSYLLHRVLPVTKGTRRSLVIWIAGPKFR